MKYLLIFLFLNACSWKTTHFQFKKIGSKEQIRKFAIFPIDCQDGNTYWLETILVERVYESPPWAMDGDYFIDNCLTN